MIVKGAESVTPATVYPVYIYHLTSNSFVLSFVSVKVFYLEISYI